MSGPVARPRPTRRGVALAIAGVICFCAGEILGQPVLRLLAGVAAAVLLLAVAMCVRRLRLLVDRRLVPDRVHRGQPASAVLTAINPNRRSTAAVQAADPPAPSPVGIPRLAPGARASAQYLLPTERRGRTPVGPLTLHREDLLGLVAATLTLGAASTLWVWPRVHEVRVLPGSRPRYHHDGVFGGRPMPGSIDLRAVREYLPGDEPRRVHWRATARTGELMVRDYVDPAQPRFTVLLDTRAAVLSAGEFENAVEVAASLAVASCAQGCRTRLSTTTGVDVEVDEDLAGRRRLLDILCEIAQHGPDVPLKPPRHRDSVAVTAFVSGGSGAIDATLVAAIARQARRTVVFDLSGTPEEAVLPSVVTIRESDPVTALAAWSAGIAGGRRAS